jgi:aldehyde dehydrogenase (NAD+)
MSPAEVLARLGLSTEGQPGFALGQVWSGGEPLDVFSPIDGGRLARVRSASVADLADAASLNTEAFRTWRTVPAPRRGELVRRIGQAVRERKEDLAALVTLEAGKIRSEALGEVQEWIDICDFAVGLSRQLHGLTMASERPSHRMMEQWHPLGPVGVITAFNFPVAVWAWNAMLAIVCGDPVTWKPSEKTPLCALAVHRLCTEVAATIPEAPPGLLAVVAGGREVGQALARDERFPLVSATGSVPMGRAVAQDVAGRLGRSLLELGGNNAMIVAPTADQELALRAAVFGAAGTAGQRCTTLRRLIVHESVAGSFLDRMAAALESLPIGDPRKAGTLVGPLIDEGAWVAMDRALQRAREEGGTVRGGERITAGVPDGGVYVRPALVEIDLSAPIVAEETFAPILYVGTYREFDQVIALNNAVPQGLSSAVFTNDVREAERFVGPAGSDCGIANVNLGTSGAEIGGAFGGEKWTGGGRESGSDSWRAYMRRATNTVNYGTDLPLAQGVEFGMGPGRTDPGRAG